jgi:hypothetical protein
VSKWKDQKDKKKGLKRQKEMIKKTKGKDQKETYGFL